MQLRKLVGDFPSKLQETTEDILLNHNVEILRLCNLSKAKNRYITNMGEENTRNRISFLWRRRILEYVYEDDDDEQYEEDGV